MKDFRYHRDSLIDSFYCTLSKYTGEKQSATFHSGEYTLLINFSIKVEKNKEIDSMPDDHEVFCNHGGVEVHSAIITHPDEGATDITDEF